MKTNSWMMSALLLLTLPLAAQEQIAAPAEERNDSVTSSIVERGPHHRVWERVITKTLPNGKTIPERQSYTEVGNGMHYKQNGQWVESKEELEVLQNTVVARQGQHQVIWAANLNTEGAIDLLAPDGKRFRSHVLGLAYTDAASGQSTLIAEPQDCIAEVAGNQVIYRNAFAGPFRADVRYTYTVSGFEQDVILRQAPPSPSEYGMDPDITRMEVWTEFLSPPTPVKRFSVLRAEADDLKRQAMVDPDLTDEFLDFGAMHAGLGNAFSQETGNRFAGDEGATTVGKSWVTIENREFLIEKVEYNVVKDQLNSLPKAAAVNQPIQGRMQAALGRAPRAKLLGALIPPKPRKVGEKPLRMAAVTGTEKGFVLDYTMENAVTNFTFWGDQTYFVSNKTVTLSGTTTIHGGTVVKFTAAPNLNRLLFTGPIDCRTAPWRPAVITARDDNTVGTIISGSTGNVGTNRYGGRAFDLNSAGTVFDLHDLQFRYHDRNIFLSAGRLIWSHSQIADCNQGFSNNTTNRAELRNLLFVDTRTGFVGGSSSTNISGEHLTFHRVGTFVSGGKIYLTNSLLISVTNSATYTGSNVETNLNDSGIFQTVGFGSHYLATNSTYRNIGTTNISTNLLAELKLRTTYPPLVLATNISGDTNLSPQIPRDTDQPDLGFHYLPLDFFVSGVTIASNVTVTATNGVAIGVDYSVNDGTTGWGFILDSARFVSAGNPMAFNRIVRAHVVQEKSSFRPSYRAVFYDKTWDYGSYPPRLCEGRFRFTEFSQLMEDGYLLFSGRAFSSLEWSHSRFFNVSLVVECAGNDPLICGITNTLWDMGATLFFGDSATGPVHLRNNLYRNHGLLFLDSTTNWTVRDNLFEYCYLDGQGSTNANSHNAYFNLLTNSLLSVSGNMTLTNLTYAIGPLGAYYQPANSSLMNTGSVSAASASLYHFTVTTNQVKETNSLVDIGIHYLALNSQGQPMDSDGDGLPDFVEDPNGNGVLDTGETCFHDPILTISSVLNYIKGSPPKLLDANAAVSGSGWPDFGDGRLTVTITAGADTHDRLAIRHQGTGSTQIGVSGTNISYSGTTIATWTGGNGTNALITLFNANATPIAVQALVRNLTFHNITNSPPTGARALKFSLTDGHGGTNAPVYQTINVICPQAIDAFLVIDVSNSMPDEDFPVAKQAASNFVSHLQLSLDRVGLVSFAGFAYLDSVLTNNGPLVQSKITGLTNKPGTTFHYALDLARSNLTSTASNVLPLIILLSDGKVGTTNGISSPPQSQIDTNTMLATNAAIAVKEAGIRVITIAYGTVGGANNGTNLMKFFASSTNDS